MSEVTLRPSAPTDPVHARDHFRVTVANFDFVLSEAEADALAVWFDQIGSCFAWEIRNQMLSVT